MISIAWAMSELVPSDCTTSSVIMLLAGLVLLSKGQVVLLASHATFHLEPL